MKTDRTITICAIVLGIIMIACAFVISIQLDRIEMTYAENPVVRQWHKTCPTDVVVQPGATIIINEEAGDEGG